MQRSLRSCVLFLTALVACHEHQTDVGKQTERNDESSESTCAEDVASLREWMKQFARDYTPVDVPAIELLSAEGSPPQKSGLVIALEPDRVWLDGTVVTDAGPINSADAIALLRNNSRLQQYVEGSWPIYIAATGDVNWNQLTDLLVGAGVRSGSLGFLFQRKRVAPAPAASALTLKLQGKTGLAETAPAIAKAFAPCAPLTEVLEEFARVGSADSLPDILGEPIANAVAACDCSVGADVVASAYWAMLLGDQPSYSVAAVTLVPPAFEPDPATVLLAYPDTAAWKDVAPKLREVASTDTRQIAFGRIRAKSATPMPKKRQQK